MDLSPSPVAMAVEKSAIQEPAAFEQVTVYLTEDVLLDFDPYLFALSGSNLQQYCTLLSWLVEIHRGLPDSSFYYSFYLQAIPVLFSEDGEHGRISQKEMRKHNSELYLETEGGVATPLSLVHIEEEFNTSPSLYQGDGVAHTKEQENVVSLARLQYDFVQEANLPTRSSEFFRTGENVSLFPERSKTHPYARGLIKDFGTAMAHQGGSLHVKATYVSLKQDGSGVVPQSREQNNPPHAVVAGDSSQKGGHPWKRSPPEKESHPGNNIEADVNQLPTSGVHGGTRDREVSSGGSNSAEKHLGPIPVTHPQVSLEGNCTFRCSKCSHPFECGSASLVGQDVQATNRGLKLASSSKEKAGKVAEKPFHCPDCGKGFLHQSSIPRHRRLHKREDSSSDSERQMPNPCVDPGTSFTIKRQKLPGIDQPFKCPLCDKSYGQKYHLKRHEQKKHPEAH